MMGKHERFAVCRVILLTALILCMMLPAGREALAEDLATEGMTPIYGFDVADGDYAVEADSSSPYFRMHDTALHVEGGEMSLTFTIASLTYRYIYPGTSAGAEQAGEESWITREEKDNTSIFTIPVPSLNEPFDCAAFSVNRERWYDRKLLIDASSLPEDAVRFAVPDYKKIRRALLYYRANGKNAESQTEEDGGAAGGSAGGAAEGSGGISPEPVRLDLADGEYSIEVNMTGGSGRASIGSPTLLTIKDGCAYVRLLWSSGNYDYMVLGGETFYNLTTDGGNSVFEIPVTDMDTGVPVIADTTAMGDPVEIAYTLEFYEDSISDKSAIPQEAAKRVLIAAMVMIILGGILNFLMKRARR